jgi:tetratricopeptide (TPR) repeat protein
MTRLNVGSVLFWAICLGGGCRSLGDVPDPSRADETLGIFGNSARREGATGAYEHYVLAEILHEQGDIAAAIAEMETAREFDPSDGYLAARHAMLLTEAGERRRAKRLLSRLLKSDPMNELGWLALAFWHREGGEIDKAVAAARRAIRVEPKQVDAALWLAELMRSEGQVTHALEVLSRAVRAHPKNPDVRLALGRIHLDLGNYVHARRHFSKFLKLRAHRADVIVELARAHEKSGDLTGAADCMELALGVDPTDEPLRLELIELLFSLKLTARAERHVRSLRPAGERDREGTLERARFLARVGDHFAARELLAQQLERNPLDAELVLTLSATEILLGRLEAAELLLGEPKIEWSAPEGRCREALRRSIAAWPREAPPCGIESGTSLVEGAAKTGDPR